jgi:HYDIN/CFA65/VesB-like, Ig-like domain
LFPSSITKQVVLFDNGLLNQLCEASWLFATTIRPALPEERREKKDYTRGITMKKSTSLLLVCVLTGTSLLSGCGGDKGGGSPTSPSPPASDNTRVIAIDGELNFGDVTMGQTGEKALHIHNRGTAPLIVTGMTVPTGGAFATTWSSGTLAPGSSQSMTIRFAPQEERSYSGTLTVNSNATSGSNTKAINARGTRPPFSRSGVGNTVFDMPTSVRRVHITGRYDQRCENFIIYIGGRLIVNEILGTCSVGSGPTYSGEHLVSGGVVEITGSNGVSWTIQELR